jgi:hypothetical protein
MSNNNATIAKPTMAKTITVNKLASSTPPVVTQNNTSVASTVAAAPVNADTQMDESAADTTASDVSDEVKESVNAKLAVTPAPSTGAMPPSNTLKNKTPQQTPGAMGEQSHPQGDRSHPQQQQSGGARSAVSKHTMKNTMAVQQVQKMTLDQLSTTCELLFSHYIVMKMWHFQTESYSVHRATDQYLVRFNDFHDKFIETAQGIYGRIVAESHTCTAKLCDSLSTGNQYITEFKKKMRMLRYSVNEHYDLVTLIDDELHQLNKLKYLLMLR